MQLDVQITVIDRQGVAHQIDAPTDMNLNLMELIRMYELAPEGTIGTCGGMALCASCQCYVRSAHELPEQQDEELAMLSEAFHVKESSRLVCQLRVTPEMAGLEIEIAPED